MEIEQATKLLALAVDAIMEIDGVLHIEARGKAIEVHVMKNVFDSMDGDVVVGREPNDIYHAQLRKEVNGITFFALVSAKEFSELYPNYGK